MTQTYYSWNSRSAQIYSPVWFTSLTFTRRYRAVKLITRGLHSTISTSEWPFALHPVSSTFCERIEQVTPSITKFITCQYYPDIASYASGTTSHSGTEANWRYGFPRLDDNLTQLLEPSVAKPICQRRSISLLDRMTREYRGKWELESLLQHRLRHHSMARGVAKRGRAQCKAAFERASKDPDQTVTSRSEILLDPH